MRGLLLAAAFLCLAVLSIGLSAATDGPVPDDIACSSAQTWHLQQALKWSERGDQAYHLGAAQAAGELSEIDNAACSGWQDDASTPGIDDTGQETSGFQAQQD